MKNYNTQMEAAKKGIVTPEMEIVAKKEQMEVYCLLLKKEKLADTFKMFYEGTLKK